MSSAGNWLKEERRRTLGDWVAVCVGCGHALRYVAEREDELPAACPQCAAAVRSRCPGCGARFASVFAVECEECGAPLRDGELFGTPIRKPKRAPRGASGGSPRSGSP